MPSAGLRRFAVLVSLSTLLLIAAGSLVTSNDASLAISDWPLAFGRLIPPLEGGIRFAFAHRAVAALVSILIFALAAWMQAREPRAWVRRLGWAAVATVLAQAVLGGVVVELADPKTLAIAHACLAQLCFGLMVAVAAAQYTAERPAPALAPTLAAAVLFAQTILGAALRHGAMAAGPHIAGAAVATGCAMWAGFQVLLQPQADAPRRRAATWLLALTFAQIFLGMAAYMARAAMADAPQPMPVVIWSTVAHVTVGSLVFGAAVALAMVSTPHSDRAQPGLARGGVAVA